MAYNCKNRLKELREQKRMTLREVADAVGSSHATMQRYESGETKNMKSEMVEKLSKFYNVLPEYLMGWSDNNSRNFTYTYEGDALKEIDTQVLPILGEVACGEPIYMDKTRESYVKLGTEIKADFCLVAEGDSMIGARIHDGDIVFVRQCSMVDNGEIAVVAINDEATLKRVYYYKDKGVLQLNAENPQYPPMIYSGAELETIHILGKAIAFQSDVE